MTERDILNRINRAVWAAYASASPPCRIWLNADDRVALMRAVRVSDVCGRRFMGLPVSGALHSAVSRVVCADGSVVRV